MNIMRALCLPALLLGIVTSPAKPPSLDLKAIDGTLSLLARHAANYPPRFASAAQRRMLEGRLRGLISTLDTAVGAHPDDPRLLVRDGFANAMGTNLDFRGCAERCTTVYRHLLALYPDDGVANLQYGAFLGSTDHARESLKYLLKAADLGLHQADYSVAISYLMLKDRNAAVQHLRAYLSAFPRNTAAQKLLATLESKNIKFERQAVKSPH